MRVIKQNSIEMIKQDMSMECTIEISVKLIDADQVENIFKSIHGVSILKLDD